MGEITFDESVINSARESLHSGFSWDVSSRPPLGREDQYDALQSFIKTCFDKCQGGGAYLSGVPGTGKSMTAHAVLKSIGQLSSGHDLPPAVVYLNCMELLDAHSVHKKILEGYNEHCRGQARDRIVFSNRSRVGPSNKDPPPVSQANSKKEFEKLVLRRITERSSRKRKRNWAGSAKQRGMIVVFLDEMDGLISKDAVILQKLLQLAKESQRLVVIGAANSLDLTERVMPELKAQGCQPELIIFPAYRACEATQVLHQRLSKSNVKLFDDKAIELCARKVSAHSGDMRHALEACTAAINIAVDDKDCSEENRGPFLVGPREILQSLGSMQDVRSTSSKTELVRSLPTSQQVLLFAIWEQSVDVSKRPILTTKGQSKRQALSCNGLKPMRAVKSKPASKRLPELMKLGSIHDKYTNVCSQLQLESNPLPEVHQMASCLHDAALIELQTGKMAREGKISLRMEHEDLKTVFTGHVLFRSMLSLSEM